MGFFSTLLSGDGSEEFLKALANFPADVEWTEAKFRNALQSYLSGFSDIELKREAGISGTGTRIDLYAHYRDHDYLITIKKGLSEQKIKKVIGEINIMMDHWQSRVAGKKTFVVFYFFGLTDQHETEYMDPFLKFMARASVERKAFDIKFATPVEAES